MSTTHFNMPEPDGKPVLYNFGPLPPPGHVAGGSLPSLVIQPEWTPEMIEHRRDIHWRSKQGKISDSLRDTARRIMEQTNDPQAAFDAVNNNPDLNMIRTFKDQRERHGFVSGVVQLAAPQKLKSWPATREQDRYWKEFERSNNATFRQESGAIMAGKALVGGGFKLAYWSVIFVLLSIIMIPFGMLVFAGIDNVYAVAGPGLGFIVLFMFFAFLDRGKK
jgi:hypothetical protein